MVGFTEIEPCEHQNADAEQREEGEARLPAGNVVKQAANRRPHHRHHGHAHGYVADHRGRLFHRHHVAHDGARQHESGNDGRLRDAADHEDGDVGREHADERCDDHDGDAGQHDRAASEEIGKRADDELQAGGGGKITRNGKLHHRVVGLEINRHGSKRGQEHIHAQRRDAGDDHQRDDVGRGGPVQKTAAVHVILPPLP